MPLQAATGTISSRSGTGTQSVTGLAFQPKAVIFFYPQSPTVNTWEAHARMGVGFDDGTNCSASFGVATGGDATPDTGRSVSNLSSIYIGDTTAGPNLVWAAKITALNADGFTLTWSTNSAAGRLIGYIAIGGSGISVNVGTASCPASNGNQAQTGIGFRPDVVLLTSALWTNLTQTISSVVDSGSMSFGWYAGAAGSGMVLSNFGDLSNPTLTGRSQSTSVCVGQINGTYDGLLKSATGVSLDSDGFTLNWTSAAAGRFGWLAIKGASPVTGVITQPTGTGNQSISLGKAPLLALFASTGLTADGTAADFYQYMFGAYDGSADVGAFSAANDNVNPSNNACKVSTATTIELVATGAVSGGTTTAAAIATVTFGATSLELNWTAADATQREIPYLVLGGPGGGGGAGKGRGGGKKGGGGVTVTYPGGAYIAQIGNAGLDIGST